MSDLVETFEEILKKQCVKRPVTLYSDKKQQNRHNLKPQDVITSVSKQLKAFQLADSFKNVCTKKDLHKYSKSHLLSVDKLPIYEEAPKQSTKFDTQLVSDTELINIIENAEIIDVHRGMTQEFETSFCHYTEKIKENEDAYLNVIDNDKELETVTEESKKNNLEQDIPIESTQYLSVITPNNIKKETGDKTQTNEDENNTQKVFSQLLNESIETEDDKAIERPISPIFMHKKVIAKSKTPSPLIFNLDKFEQFERIAIPILEANDIKTAKQVLNSQILNKELDIRLGQDVFLNDREELSPILHNKYEKTEDNPLIDDKFELKTNIMKDTDLDTDLEFIEIDKATSEGLINEVKENKILKAENNVVEDEILFSSDEEDNVIVKDFQDMPFTCALETSFYDQPDVLDKTMFVAFQTASNKSIQIFTESFAQAKNILSGSAVEEVTVTDLVNNCDNSIKNKVLDKPDEINEVFIDEDAFNTAQDFDNGVQSKVVIEDNTDRPKTPDKESPNDNINEVIKENFKGFMTANNKEIKLSETALNRCKKVFRDIDLNEDFDKASETECKAIEEVANKETINEEIPNIDDVIIQEFENIEMSLQEEKSAKQNNGITEPCVSNNEDAISSEITESKLKDIFKDIDFDVIISEAVPNNSEYLPLNNNEKESFVGFKTASNKTIDISKEAIDKTKNLFQDLDSVKFPRKSSKENTSLDDMEKPSTSKTELKNFKTTSNRSMKILEKALSNTGNENIKSPEEKFSKNPDTNIFVGFKTASNKSIKISKEALSKTDRIYKDIDNIDFPIKNVKENQIKPDSAEILLDFNKPSTSKSAVVGFKTANNKEIKISDKALAKTKNIFKDIDSEDFKYPENRNKDEVNKGYKALSDNTINEGLKKSLASTSFQGFKTASNRPIKVSESSLAKTKNIFKDIDSEDFSYPDKESNSQENDKIDKISNKDFVPTTTSFQGFKTAGNRVINVSENALAKTKYIFKDPVFPEREDNDNIPEETINIASEVFKKPVSASKSFQGFKTASNRVIKVSENALAKTKNIFKDLASDGIEISFTKPTDLCNQDKEREEKPKASDKILEFVGFKTASNRNIDISKAALEKTKYLFKDIDSNTPENPLQDLSKDSILKEIDKKSASKVEDFNQPSTSKFVGFQTANNKKITISKDSLAKTKNIFKDIDCTDCNFPEKPARNENINENKSSYPKVNNNSEFVGFKTANNKLIKISKKALAKTKDIFKDINPLNTEEVTKHKADYPGFEGDKNVEHDIQKVFDKETDIINENIKTSVPKFQGFQTASNKKVEISKEPIIKSRKLLQDIDESIFNIENKSNEFPNKTNKAFDFEDNVTEYANKDIAVERKSSPIFKGFQTANKKPVAISKEALAKTRKIFQEFQDPDEHEPPFYGFKTGNDEEVALTQEALARSNKIIEDIDKNNIEFQTDYGLKETEKQGVKSANPDIIKTDKYSNFKFSFQTGNKKQISVSEEAVKRSKRLFSDIGGSTDDLIKKKYETSKEHSISNIVDTQVLNNFNESLHTEDFHTTPVKEAKSKRSGSPILSCPKAKKRKKFETPYSQKLPKPAVKTKVTNKNVNKINFREDYKKNKKYNLKDVAKMTENLNYIPDPYLSKFNFDNLLQFEFKDGRNNLPCNSVTIEFLKELFLESVNPKLVPNGWLDNHLKLILWKLISYEIKFKSAVECTARNVIDQLKYRYEKELYNAQRPALRKILEKDDVPSKTIVLCVAQIYEDGVSVLRPSTTNIELLLTDGWYTIKTSIDKMLAQLVCDGKITVGIKIVTNGAELVNCEQGVSPWEDTSAIRLKIFGNSTRRAHWDARLGYHSNAAILTQLSSVRLDGGKVSKLRVFVTRVYPALYVEKFEDGSTVTRSERLEHLYQMKTETERQAIMEKLYEEVEREFSDQESQDSEGLPDASMKRSCLDSGSQIAKLMKKSKDPAEFRAGLTSSQAKLLEDHTTKRRERLLEDIQQRIRDKIEKAGVCINRNVVILLKVRVVGVVEKNGVEVTKGMISIWKPNDAILEIIKEGAWIDVMNVVPTAIRYSEIQISAGRQSVFSISKYKEPEKFKPYTNLLKRKCFTIKDLAQNPTMVTDYNEIDTAGIVFLIDPSISEFDSNKNPFQNVYLADLDKNIICINFWGGLKKFGYQNVLDTGQIISCANLQKRAGNTRKCIPQFRVTEFSVFTKTPKNENARILVDDLRKKCLSLDRRKIVEDCVVLKNNYSVLKNICENISPYRFNQSDYNSSKNKIFIDSPLVRPNRIEDFNLTGLDFESTFRQTDTQNLSEEELKRKKIVNEKIAKLKMYGEPPPLANIHIINKSINATKSYKSPLVSKNNESFQKSNSVSSILLHSKSDSSNNVASEEKSPENGGNSNDVDVTSSSPLLLNRTYVKTVNPVKINFDVKDNNDSSIDYFAEEFDGSPPLSLD